MLNIEPHDLTGHRIGKYKFLERIGRGGMAFVYRGEHVDFGLPIAIKVLFHKHSKSPEKRTRFQREAQLQFRLKHTNLVRTFDFIDEQGILAIVMDWVEGVDLATYAAQRRGRIPFEDLRRFFLPVLDVVHYAHSNKIIHRDLKPSNILLEGNPGREVPKVLDFGVAKLLNDTDWKTEEGVLLGTPAYLSPEQVEHGVVDHRADIYALGITFYQLATGQLPFSGDTVLEVLLAHRDKQAPPMRFWDPDIPGSLDYVIQKALAKRPDERFPDCESFADALLAAFQNPHYPYIDPNHRHPHRFEDTKTQVSLSPHTSLGDITEESKTPEPIPTMYPNLSDLLKKNKSEASPTERQPGLSLDLKDLDQTWINEEPHSHNFLNRSSQKEVTVPNQPRPPKNTFTQITQITETMLSSFQNISAKNNIATEKELTPHTLDTPEEDPFENTAPVPIETESSAYNTQPTPEVDMPPDISNPSAHSIHDPNTTVVDMPELYANDGSMFRIALLLGLLLGLTLFVVMRVLN